MPPTNNHKENTPNDTSYGGFLAAMNTPHCDSREVESSDSGRHRSGSGGKRLSGERDPDNDPPHSRLFVVCGRHIDEEELGREFGVFGEIEYCRTIRDKHTNESKGLCYVKFTKTSSAAAAVEEMDGRCLYEHSAPIRVQVADAKGSNGRAGKKLQYSKEPEDTPPRSRLFVVCPKEMTETQMTECFARFEGLEYCKVITDKATGESKGFAYVKFSKSSSAARAMEAVHDSGSIQNMKVKVLIADPKVKKADSHISADARLVHQRAVPPMMMSPPHYGGTYLPPGAYYAPPYMGTTFFPIQEPRLLVICHSSASEEDMRSKFEELSGFEAFELSDVDTSASTTLAHVRFSSMQAAVEARNALDGTEFPPSWTLSVRFWENELGATPPNSPPTWSALSPPHMTYPAHPMMGVVPQHAMGELFPVCEPRVSFNFSGPALTDSQMQELFAPFGAIEFYQMDSDSSGIVAYTSQNAAFAAQASLNGKDMHGGTMYVMVMQSMPIPIQAPQMPGPYHISMSPPGYAMSPTGPMMMQTQFPLEW